MIDPKERVFIRKVSNNYKTLKKYLIKYLISMNLNQLKIIQIISCIIILTFNFKNLYKRVNLRYKDYKHKRKKLKILNQLTKNKKIILRNQVLLNRTIKNNKIQKIIFSLFLSIIN